MNYIIIFNTDEDTRWSIYETSSLRIAEERGNIISAYLSSKGVEVLSWVVIPPGLMSLLFNSLKEELV